MEQGHFPDSLPGDNSTVTSEVQKEVQRRAEHLPKVFRGTASPTITPQVVGDIFVDTNNKKIYIATGIVSSSNWTVVN